MASSQTYSPEVLGAAAPKTRSNCSKSCRTKGSWKRRCKIEMSLKNWFLGPTVFNFFSTGLFDSLWRPTSNWGGIFNGDLPRLISAKFVFKVWFYWTNKRYKFSMEITQDHTVGGIWMNHTRVTYKWIDPQNDMAQIGGIWPNKMIETLQQCIYNEHPAISWLACHFFSSRLEMYTFEMGMWIVTTLMLLMEKIMRKLICSLS